MEGQSGHGSSRGQDQVEQTKWTEVLETELKCIICTELLYSASTLNCSHSFCEACIVKWLQRNLDCPVCRSVVYSINKCLVINAMVDKFVETQPEDAKELRSEQIARKQKMLRTRASSKIVQDFTWNIESNQDNQGQQVAGQNVNRRARQQRRRRSASAPRARQRR